MAQALTVQRRRDFVSLFASLASYADPSTTRSISSGWLVRQFLAKVSDGVLWSKSLTMTVKWLILPPGRWLLVSRRTVVPIANMPNSLWPLSRWVARRTGLAARQGSVRHTVALGDSASCLIFLRGLHAGLRLPLTSRIPRWRGAVREYYIAHH
jgi:hypothetical protein